MDQMAVTLKSGAQLILIFNGNFLALTAEEREYVFAVHDLMRDGLKAKAAETAGTGEGISAK